MKKISMVLLAILLGLTALWLLEDNIFASQWQFMPTRGALINYTGIVAVGVMSICMILAIRPVWFESHLGGLDKMYRLHKWLGIAALVYSLLHWLLKESPSILVGLNLITLPPRKQGGAPTGESNLGVIETWFKSMHEPATGLGSWAFYIAVVLMVLALIKYFPYKYFFKTHYFLIFTYFVLVFHSVVLMRFEYWSSIVGVVTGLLMFLGSIAAVGILFKQRGKDRRAVGVIEELDYHPDSQVLKVAIQLKDQWAGHQAGQFAFVQFENDEPHPFTITSGWRDDGKMFFLIKQLGDYTNVLAHRLKVNQWVHIEGPYGRFNFEHSKPRQIWIAGGIGITPFIARMHHLASKPDGKHIDLFMCVSELDEKGLQKVRQDAREAKVNFHLIHSPTDGRLDAEKLIELVPDWQEASIWFCGGAAFADSLRDGLAKKGLGRADFHQEFFEMR